VPEAPQCNRETAPGQDTDNKRTVNEYKNKHCKKKKEKANTQYII
jgi:hypothetical protein